jgi:hypothetical protein
MNANAAWRNNQGDVEIGPKEGPFFIDISGKTECGPFTSLDDAISKARAMGAGPGRKLVDALLQRLREAPMPEPKTEAQEAAELIAAAVPVGSRGRRTGRVRQPRTRHRGALRRRVPPGRDQPRRVPE